MIARTVASASLSDRCAISALRGFEFRRTQKIGDASLTRRAKPGPLRYGLSTPKASPRPELVLMELATDDERPRGLQDQGGCRLDAAVPTYRGLEPNGVKLWN